MSLSEQDAVGTPATVVSKQEASVGPNAVSVALSNLLDAITNIKTSQDKANSAFISYMDRVVLLAGGTLTLLFTVIANLGPHLQTIHQSARHTPYILTCCWLLASAIAFGLLYNTAAIKAQHKIDHDFSILITDMKLKISILTMNSKADVSGIPSLATLLQTKGKDSRFFRKVVGVLGILAQVCLLCAFCFLVLFLQSNLPLLLNN